MLSLRGRGQSLLIAVAVCFLVLLGAFVRLLGKADYYPIPGSFRAYSVYDITYILQHGHELASSSGLILTPYSSNVLLGSQDVLRIKLEAAVIMMLGLGPADLRTYYAFAFWGPLVLFPLISLALYRLLCQVNRTSASYPAYLSLLAFCLLGSFTIMMVTYHGEANTATGYTFLFAAFYGILAKPESKAFGRVMFFVFSLLVILLYHTAAILLGSIAITMALTGLRQKQPTDAPYTRGMMVAVLCMVVSYFMYVSVSFFRLFAENLGTVPDLLSFLFAQDSNAAPRGTVLSGLLSKGDNAFQLRMAILSLATALPVGLFLLMALTGHLARLVDRAARQVIAPWLLGLIPFSIGLFLWAGLSGLLWKDGEFGSVFCTVALAGLLASRMRAKFRLLLCALALFCIVLSCFQYVAYERYGPSDLTYAEQDAAVWLAAQAKPTDVVFTELRLAAPLIELNHLAVTGINDYAYPAATRQLLAAIYYGSDPVAALRGLQRIAVPPHTRLRYLLFSRRDEHDLPGVEGFDYTFRGAKAGFYEKFGQIQGFSQIYDNGTAVIYSIGPGALRSAP